MTAVNWTQNLKKGDHVVVHSGFDNSAIERCEVVKTGPKFIYVRMGCSDDLVAFSRVTGAARSIAKGLPLRYADFIRRDRAADEVKNSPAEAAPKVPLKPAVRSQALQIAPTCYKTIRRPRPCACCMARTTNHDDHGNCDDCSAALAAFDAKTLV